jgi:predicted DNA-binding protein
MIHLELPMPVTEALRHHAELAGKPLDEYLSMIVEQHLEEMEDLAVAKERLQSLGQTFSSEDVRRQLGLDG